MNPLWILTAFAGTFGVVWVLGIVIAGRPKSIGTRIRELTSSEPIEPEQVQSHIRRVDAVPLITRLLTGRRVTDRLTVELSAAGLPIRPSEFVAIIGGTVLLSQLVAFTSAPGVIGHVVLGVIGIGIPTMVVRSLQTKRRAAFDAQIVDALVTMSASFRSGFALLKAMQMVSQEMQPPISREFERVVNEVGVGRQLEDALRASVARVGSYDFDLVVTAILIHLQVGGNLSEVLETIANTIRERRKVMGEMKALTAEGRISGVVLVVLPIALAAIIQATRPKYLSVLMTDPIGPSLIIGVVVLQLIGILIMRRMLTLDI